MNDSLFHGEDRSLEDQQKNNVVEMLLCLCLSPIQLIFSSWICKTKRTPFPIMTYNAHSPLRCPSPKGETQNSPTKQSS